MFCHSGPTATLLPASEGDPNVMPDDSPQGGHVFDLGIGETVGFRGSSVKLVALDEPRDAVRGVIRFPSVTVEVDGARARVPAALYHMPQVVNGVRIGCSVTRGIADALMPYADVFALDKDARIRCWEPEAPLFGPEPLTYPVGQVWFASMTQLGNERTYVDAGELPLNDFPHRHIYHHSGVDIGGYDKAVPLIAPVSGKLIRCGLDWADGEEHYRQAKDDSISIRDERGWRHVFAHIDMIEPSLVAGQWIEAGDTVGVLGQTGSSGGWAHLHYSMQHVQPSGRYGEADGYPFILEAYLHEHPGALLACARPHRTAAVGEPVELDGSRSICDGGRIAEYEWQLQNGDSAAGAKTTVTYDREGVYSEMLTVSDGRGRTDVDFCVVHVLPPDADPARTPPTMHAAYYPTHALRAGQPIAFKVRSFFRGAFESNEAGEELWDFGDGTQGVTLSKGTFDERWHAYDRPGRYIVTVQRTGRNGRTATARLKVVVG